MENMPPVSCLREAIDFVLELVARTAATRACGIAALDHEVGNDPVKRDSVVVAPGRED